MTTEEQLGVVLEELVYLKKTGVDRVSISDKTLEQLRTLRFDSPEKDLSTEKPETVQTNSSEKTHGKNTTPAPSPLDRVVQKTAKQERTKAVVDTPNLFPNPPVIALPQGDKETKNKYLKELVLNCPTSLKQLNPNKKLVYGNGNLDADIFFCGEAPGADEETQGEPFVGEAGNLLTKMIQAMGTSRENVYIANIMKWRPQTGKAFGNRPPTEEEMNFCLPYLKAQIEIVQPKVLVALGGTAVNGLLGFDSKRKLGQVRGKWHSYEGTDMMITFHPSYLLRNNTLRTKRMVWEDLLQVMEKVNLDISEKQRGYFLPK